MTTNDETQRLLTEGLTLWTRVDALLTADAVSEDDEPCLRADVIRLTVELEQLRTTPAAPVQSGLTGLAAEAARLRQAIDDVQATNAAAPS